jgi:hypothetical protein
MASPDSVSEMLAWLRAHPEEPFFSVFCGGRLVIGTRDDDGELNAWACEVADHAWDYDDAARSRRAKEDGR